MPHLILQLALLVAVVFVVGSLVGSFARKRKAKTAVVLSEPEQQVEAAKSDPEKNEHKLQTPVPAIPEAKPVAEQPAIEKADEALEPVKAEETATEETSATVAEVSGDAAAELIAEPVEIEELPDPEPVFVKEPEPVVELGLPQLLDAARDGKPDDLLKIKGIGPTLQGKLYALGVYHYDQLAGWDADNAVWIGKKLNFRGRVEREEWGEQAAALVKLGEKERADKAPKKASAKTASKKATAKAATVKAAVKRAPVKSAKSKAKTVTKKADI